MGFLLSGTGVGHQSPPPSLSWLLAGLCHKTALFQKKQERSPVMHTRLTYLRWDDCIWSVLPELTGLPRPAMTLGRRLCGHDSTTPPLDFRSCSDAQFDKEKDELSQLGDQHGSRSNGGQRLRPSRRAGQRALRNSNVTPSGRSR